MRYGSIVAALIMAVAAAALPRLMARGMGVKRGDTLALVQSIKKMNSAEFFEAKVDRQLDALQNGRTEDLTLPEMAAVQDFAAQGASMEKKAELVGALMKAFKEQEPMGSKIRTQTLRDSEKLRRFYRGARSKALPAFYLLAGVFAIVGLVGLSSAGRGFARFFLTLGFAQSGNFLIFASILAFGYYVVARINPWPLLPWEVVAAPASYMLICGACLRVLDPNVPVWNTMLKSLASPVISGAAVLGLGLCLPKPTRSL